MKSCFPVIKITGLISILGFIIEFLSGGRGVPKIEFPFNTAVLLMFSVTLILFYVFYKNEPVFDFLTSIPTAIGSLITILLFAAVMGIIPQDQISGSWISRFGITHLKESWAFLFEILFLLTILGLTVIKRIQTINYKNIGFFINHFGLWLIIAASLFGSGDVKKMYLKVNKNSNNNNLAYFENNLIKLPFSLKLLDFRYEEYSPKLILTDNRTGKSAFEKNENNFDIIEKQEFTYQKIKIKINKYNKYSVFDGNQFLSDSVTLGAAPSALITVSDLNTEKAISGWISCGSFMVSKTVLKISDLYSISMTIPEQKSFAGKIATVNKNSEKDTFWLKVNQPRNIEGWEIYLSDFEKDMGKFSDSVLIETVRDPWQKVVYIGFFMLIGGTFFIFRRK
jgi:hypothetical protein